MNILLLPAYVKKINSNADKSWTITVGTNELTPEQLGQLGLLHNAFGFMAFKKEDFSTEERKFLDTLKADEMGKSTSQRLRNVMFVRWSQHKEGFSTFQDFYTHYMERTIEEWKATLDE